MIGWVCLLAVALADDPATAPLLETLPADGRWAKYDLRLQLPGQDQNLSWAVRSVGQFQQSGRDVRCIETELKGGGNDVPDSVHRMLVPLDAFGPGKHALGQTVRMWVKTADAAPESFDNISGDPLTALFLAGATEEVRKAETKEAVNWQRGKLECDVYTGRSTQEIGDAKFVTTWTILRHKDVPFGLAGLRMKMTIGAEAELIQVTMTLQDHGTDAKAVLPELTP